MSRIERAAGLAHWFPTLPERLDRLEASLAAAVSQLAELHATLEAGSKAQLESLRILTRSVGELNTRLERLERLERAASETVE